MSDALTPDADVPADAPEHDDDHDDAAAPAGTSQPAEFYCPGCGRKYLYPAECNGQTPATPHPPIQTVDAAELDGHPDKHTPAPASE